MLSVPQDELSSQFFNFNHQQCLLNQLKNYWHKTIFPPEQLHQSPCEKNPLAPLGWATGTRSSIIKPWTISDSQAKPFILVLISTSKFREAQGVGIERNEFAWAGSSTHKYYNTRLIFWSPLQELMTVVKVWENVMIQWVTQLVCFFKAIVAFKKTTNLQAFWKLEDNHLL